MARDLRLVAAMMIVVGLVLAVADRSGARARTLYDLTLRDGIMFGLAQACALVPGVSRSGSTISAGLFLGYTREAATRYSFLLSIPAVLLSGVYEATKIGEPGPVGAVASDHRRHRDRLRRRLRSHRLAAALRIEPLVHAVRRLSRRPSGC